MVADMAKRMQVETGVAAKVARLVEPAIEELGFRLVRVRLTGNTLQIMAERPDGTMTVGGCQDISRTISPLLDVNDPMSNKYSLEVSSPGMDRPIATDDDGRRNTGRKVALDIEGSDSARTVVGTLLGLEDGTLKILSEESGLEESFSWAEVVYAKQYLPF